jgi:catechol 2,3-dioxygenase-like lactoylglutathione lyase family enzyme
VLTVDHVTIATPAALEVAVIDWYADVLGLTRLPKPEGTSSSGAWFRTGDVQLHVTVEAMAPKNPGHFGIVVDDFTAAVRHLRTAGAEIEAARTIPGRHRCYTRDPAGNTIEVMQYEEAPDAQED